MKKLQREQQLSYLFISHAPVSGRTYFGRVGVMYLGSMVELLRLRKNYLASIYKGAFERCTEAGSYCKEAGSYWKEMFRQPISRHQAVISHNKTTFVWTFREQGAGLEAGADIKQPATC